MDIYIKYLKLKLKWKKIFRPNEKLFQQIDEYLAENFVERTIKFSMTCHKSAIDKMLAELDYTFSIKKFARNLPTSVVGGIAIPVLYVKLICVKISQKEVRKWQKQ